MVRSAIVDKVDKAKSVQTPNDSQTRGKSPIEIWNMQEYREYLKYSPKYAGIWNIMEYNARIPNIVDDFASDGPLDGE